MNGAPVMIALAALDVAQNHEFTVRIGNVRIRVARGKPAHSVLAGCQGGVIDVHVSVGGEIGIEGDPQEALLGERTGGHRQKRGWKYHSVLHNPELPRLLCYEQTAIGRKFHSSDTTEATHKESLFKPGRKI